MFSRCTSSLWWEYSCRLPYPHFAASAGADVTLLVTKSPFFLFVCFCFLLKTPVSEQSSTEAAGSAVHIPHITVNQGQRFSVEFETRSGEDFVMPAVLTSFGSSASEYFCLLLFTKKMSTTLTLNLDPSCKWFYCTPSIYFIVITKLCNHIFHFYGLMASWDAFQESCTSPMIKKRKKKNSWGKM